MGAKTTALCNEIDQLAAAAETAAVNLRGITQEFINAADQFGSAKSANNQAGMAAAIELINERKAASKPIATNLHLANEKLWLALTKLQKIVDKKNDPKFRKGKKSLSQAVAGLAKGTAAKTAGESAYTRWKAFHDVPLPR